MKTKFNSLFEKTYKKLSGQRFLKEEADTDVELQKVQDLLDQIIVAVKETSTNDVSRLKGRPLSVVDEIDAWISDAGYHKIGRVEGWGTSLLNATTDDEEEIADALQVIADINFAIDNGENDTQRLKMIKSILANANYLK